MDIGGLGYATVMAATFYAYARMGLFGERIRNLFGGKFNYEKNNS